MFALNLRAQERRAEAGEIDLSGPSVSADAYRLVAGDVVASRHNDRQLRTDRGLMVKNRDQWHVIALHPGGALTVSGSTGAVRLPAEYVAEHVELAYAQTSHANQGRTVDRSYLLLDGPADTRGVYVPMTRGRLSNEAFVVRQGEQSAVDVMAQALARDWIDEPAVARRAELAKRAAPSELSRDPGGRLRGGELRGLLERDAVISKTLSMAVYTLGACSDHLGQATGRHEQLRARLAEAEERQRTAQEVIDEHDHPVRRRLHRTELDHARVSLRQAGLAIEQYGTELAEIQARLPGLRSDLDKAQETWAARPTLERERHGIRQRLEKDLDARTDGLATNPPSYVVDLLGPRPDRAANAQLWDVAAARIEQHREAFDISGEHEILGSPCRNWDDSAIATSQRAAFAACDALDRTLGRGLAIEPPGLELGL